MVTSTLLINGYIRLRIQPLMQSIIPDDLQTLFALFYGNGTWGIFFYNRNYNIISNNYRISSVSLLYDHYKIKEYNIIDDNKRKHATYPSLSFACYANNIPINFDDNFTQKCIKHNISNPSALIQCNLNDQTMMYSAVIFDKNNINAFRYNLATNNNGNVNQCCKYSNINHSLYSVVAYSDQIKMFNLDFKKNKAFNWNLLHSSDMSFNWIRRESHNRNCKLELVNNDSSIYISTRYQFRKSLCHIYNLQNDKWLNCATLNAQMLSNTCYSNSDERNNRIFCYTNTGIWYYELNTNKWFRLCENLINDKPLKVMLWYGDNHNTLYYALETIDDLFVYYGDLRCINGTSSWMMDNKLKKLLNIPYYIPVAL